MTVNMIPSRANFMFFTLMLVFKILQVIKPGNTG